MFLLISLFTMSLTVYAAAPTAISVPKPAIAVGDTMKLTVKNAKGKAVWKSSRPSVAKVNAKGVVTALKKGSTTVTARISRKKYTCKVTVTAARLNADSISLDVKGSKTLRFTNSKGKVSWSSSDQSVAEVASGKVTGMKVGNAVISARIGSSVYKCKVTVKNPDVATESLDFQVAGGGDFVCGKSSASIQFSMKRDAYDVGLQVINSLGEAVYSESYSECTAKNVYSLTWTPSGSADAGSYRVLVKAGAQESYSPYLTLKKPGIFADGNGSPDNPYLVSTLAQFKEVELNNGCYYKQINDIDGGQEMVSGIYSMDNPFTGCYDGNGYTIRNIILKDSGKQDMALFGGIGETGSLKNINLSNIDVVGAYGSVGLLSLENRGTISNCSITDCTINNTLDRQICSAFLCVFNQESGLVSGCLVKNCSASLNNSRWGGAVYAAGLLVDNHGKLLDCTVKGMDIFGQMYHGVAYLSGLVRWNNGFMQNCAASGAVLGSNIPSSEADGGICQLNEGVIRNCSFSGTAINEGVHTNKGSVS